jgi:hypothetical protein
LLGPHLSATFASGGKLSHRLQNTSKLSSCRVDSISGTRRIAVNSGDSDSIITADTAASKSIGVNQAKNFSEGVAEGSVPAAPKNQQGGCPRERHGQS